MNKKVLGLLAASAAVVGSAFFATPARAVTQNVDVEVTVDEVLFLRTFDKVELRVTQGDLNGDTGSETDFDPNGSTDGTTQIDLTPPVLAAESTNATITKSVDELYAVWGNGDSDNAPTVTIKVAPDGDELTNGETGRDFRKAMMSVDDESGTFSNRDLSEIDEDDAPAQIGGVSLTFNFRNDDDEEDAPIAGTYTGGVLTVEATSITN